GVCLAAPRPPGTHNPPPPPGGRGSPINDTPSLNSLVLPRSHAKRRNEKMLRPGGNPGLFARGPDHAARGGRADAVERAAAGDVERVQVAAAERTRGHLRGP